MKKTIIKSLLLGACALVAMNASAQKLYFASGIVEPGKQGYLNLMYENNIDEGTTWECEFELPEGLVLVNAYNPKNIELSIVGTDEEGTPAQSMNNNGIYEEGNNYISNSTEDHIILPKLVATQAGQLPMKKGFNTIARILVEADANFAGGQIHITKFLHVDNGVPEGVDGQTVRLNNVETPEQCYVYTPAQAEALPSTSLADVVANGVDGQLYKIADPLKVVQKLTAEEYVMVSDGNNNWMRLAMVANGIYSNMAGRRHNFYAANTLYGSMSQADCNQVLTVYTAPANPANTGSVEVDIEEWKLGQTDVEDPHFHFAPKVNQVINVKGFLAADEDGSVKMTGFSNGEGQYVSVATNWADGDSKADLADAAAENAPVLVENAVALLKEPWDKPAGAPARAQNDGIHNYENYQVQLTSFSYDDNILTGVENVNMGKNVVSVEYVNAAGMTSSTPFKGVNIVVTRYNDGSQVTTKVVK